MAKNIIIGCMMLGLLVCAQSAVGAQYDYELAYGSSSRDSGFREAVEMDDWLERGRAAVTESPVFPDGVRLTAWGGKDAYEPGLASAIYYFKVPRWAQYLKVTIQYRDTARDDAIAGRLWIKSADRDQYEALGAGEETPLYGDTFVLRSDQTSETLIVPRSRHVEDDMVEMHIVAGGQDCLDIRDVRLVFLETRPGNLTIVRRTYNDYWDRWPRHRYAYHYYYWGPLFWPKTYVVYECWDIPSPFYWITWRPWFFVNIIRVHHHHPWWGPRRYTVIYHVDVKHPPIKRKPLIHQRLKERDVYITKTIRPTPLTRKTVLTPMPANQARQQEVQLKKSATSRTVETTTNRDPTLQEQPVRADTGQAKQQSRVGPVNREKTIQVPAQKKLNQADSVDPKTNKRIQPAPLRRPNTGQVNQKKKEAEKSPVNTQTKTVKKAQVINKPDSRPARPPHATPQSRTAKQQPRSRSVALETVREQTTVHAAQNQRIKQGGAVQKHANIGQGNRPQPHQETRQPRSYAEQQRRR
jgi:hypothetical protein